MSKEILWGIALTMGLSVPAQAQTMQEAFDSALENNPRIQAERARLKGVEEQLVQARAAGLPTLDLDANLGGQYTDRVSNSVTGESDFKFNSSNSVSLNAFQPLYQGGRVSGLKSAAEYEILAAREDLRATELDVLVDAAAAHLGVYRADADLLARKESVQKLLSELDAVEERQRRSASTRTDVAQTRARLEARQNSLARAVTLLQQSQAAYRRATGTPSGVITRPDGPAVPDSVEAAISSARNTNPRLQAADYRLQAAEAGIKVAKSDVKPSLGVSGRLRSGESEFSNLPRASSAEVGLQFRMPLYNGGLFRSRIRAAESEADRIRFENRDLTLALDQAVSDSYAEITGARERLSSAERQVSAADEALKGIRIEYDVGNRDAIDVLNAEQELLDAKIALITAETDLLINSYRLRGLLGRME